MPQLIDVVHEARNNAWDLPSPWRHSTPRCRPVQSRPEAKKRPGAQHTFSGRPGDCLRPSGGAAVGDRVSAGLSTLSRTRPVMQNRPARREGWRGGPAKIAGAVAGPRACSRGSKRRYRGWDSNPHGPQGPTDFRTTPIFIGGAWSGLSLHRIRPDVGAARQVSAPSRSRAWLRITSQKASLTLSRST